MQSTTKTGLEYAYSYDGLERRTGVTDPRTDESITDFNSLGQVDYVEDAATNRTSFAYESTTGRRISTTDALSNTVYTAYSVEGQTIGTWGATYPVFYSFDQYDRMSGMFTLRDTNVAINSYSDFVSNSNSFDRTSWLYDFSTGLLTNKIYSDGHGTSYSYTDDGKLYTRTWARGITTTYSYTNTGEMIGIDYSDATPDITFTYDRLGRQVTVTDAQGVRTFNYDPATLALTSEVVVGAGVPGGTNVLTRTQDSLGRSSELDLNGVYDVDYGFDNRGRFLGLIATNGGVEVANVTYGYLDNSDLITGYSNSVSSVSSVRGYEDNRNLLTAVDNRYGAALISGFAYENDAVGRRTDRVDTGSSTATNSFGYNTRSELTSAEMGENTFSWILDNIGNRESASRNGTNRIFEANELNQYASISNGGLRELSYDFDGNLTNDAVFAHTFNGENRLIMSEPLNVTNGSKRVQSAYDYQGRRFRKVVETWDGSSWASATTNIFVYDGFNLIQEQDGTGGVIRSYVRGLDLSGSLQGAGGTGGLLAMISGNNTYFYLGDANGNITELLDTNGEVVAHYEWDAYGNRLNAPGENEPENPFGFSSQYRDKETGLDMYIFCPYSPELERWPSRDPLTERGAIAVENRGLSRFPAAVELISTALRTLDSGLYRFVDNAAVRLVDMLGRQQNQYPVVGSPPLSHVTPKPSDPENCGPCQAGEIFGKTQAGQWRGFAEVDGCSMPDAVEKILETILGEEGYSGDKDNPMGGCSFYLPCAAHDACYQTCYNGNQHPASILAAKNRCDDTFLSMMNNACDDCYGTPTTVDAFEKLRKQELAECRRWASVYHWAVQEAGGKSWTERQKERCVSCCCPVPSSSPPPGSIVIIF